MISHAMREVLARVPTQADLPRPNLQKAGLPAPLAKKERQKEKTDKDDAFRDAIWKRDKGKSRATGKKLVRSGTTEWSQLGEVDHSIQRSLAPERVYDLSNALLLSKEENRLRKVRCAEAPEFYMFSYTGPDDRSQPQHFVWRDKTGKITKERNG